MVGAEVRERLGKVIDENWHSKHNYTKPSSSHYPDLFLWDSCSAAIINSRRGKPEVAARELRTVLQGIDPTTGFIPNRRILGKPNLKDLEAFFTFTKRSQSNYTQPPLMAHSTWEIYEGFMKKGEGEKGKAFLKEVYGENKPNEASGLKGSYGYFKRFRENGNGSKLLLVVTPKETGRDSDRSLLKGAVRIPTRGLIARLIPAGKEIIPLANTVLNTITHFKINLDAKKNNWEVEKSRYRVNDVMFNVLYVDNLRYMAKIGNELGNKEEGRSYENLAREMEEEILSKMWNEDDGFFYNLDKDGKQIKIASISGLFPLLLNNISEYQLRGLLDKLESLDWFNTPYPIPSVPVNSPHHDASHKEKSLWSQGEVYMITNFHLLRGIVKQVERFKTNENLLSRLLPILNRVTSSSESLLEKSGLREFYSSLTGKGYRVKNFTWSGHALHFDKSNLSLNQFGKNQEELGVS